MALFPIILPNLRKRLERELQKTQHELLDAEDDLARAQANVKFLSDRASRIRAQLALIPSVEPLK